MDISKIKEHTTEVLKKDIHTYTSMTILSMNYTLSYVYYNLLFYPPVFPSIQNFIARESAISFLGIPK